MRMLWRGAFLALVLSFLVFGFRRARRGRFDLSTGATVGVVALLAVAPVDFPFSRPAELFVFWTLLAMGYLTGASRAPLGGAQGDPVTQT